jgi:predicted DNA-binding protein with PD1-like motif
VFYIVVGGHRHEGEVAETAEVFTVDTESEQYAEDLVRTRCDYAKIIARESLGLNSPRTTIKIIGRAI